MSTTTTITSQSSPVTLHHAEPVFGHAMLPYFKFADGFINFNHGSFGSTPRMVLDKQREYTDDMEAYPDIWFRKQYRDLVGVARRSVSEYVHANESDVVLVENASSGVNSVLRALNLQEGETVLHLSTAYSMVVNTLEYLQQREKINLLQVQINFPITSDGIVLAVQEAIAKHEAKGGKIRLAIFSHITSVPAVILPIEKLASLCHDHNIIVFIDGAHALGAIPLNLSTLGVDYYVANAHKWLYCPKGTAFLWVSPTMQIDLTPTVISSENKWNATDYINKYLYTGTRDYTAFCSIPEALKFREFVGGEQKIFSYLHDLAVAAGHELAAMWGTEVLSEDSTVGSMVNVRIPTNNSAIALSITDKLFAQHKMYMIVYPLNNQYWTRLSSQIYMEIGDFRKMGAIVKQICSGDDGVANA